VTEDSGIVTGDSGQSRKSVTFNQNLRSRSVGTTGHVQTESAVNIARNTQSLATSNIFVKLVHLADSATDCAPASGAQSMAITNAGKQSK
jgi:hypothetical protein